jgi:hypothetical protein
VRVEGVTLEDHGNLAGAWWQISHHPTPNEDVSIGWRFQPTNHAQQRRLTTPGRPQQDEKLSVRGGQVDVVDSSDTIETLAQITDFDDGHG